MRDGTAWHFLRVEPVQLGTIGLLYRAFLCLSNVNIAKHRRLGIRELVIEPEHMPKLMGNDVLPVESIRHLLGVECDLGAEDFVPAHTAESKSEMAGSGPSIERHPGIAQCKPRGELRRSVPLIDRCRRGLNNLRGVQRFVDVHGHRVCSPGAHPYHLSLLNPLTYRLYSIAAFFLSASAIERK